MRKGVSLIELLIVVVILGVLATIAVPSFTKMMEKAKADQTITYLKTIRTGEKIYYASNSTYIECANANEIRSNLGAEITEESYTFQVTGNPDIEDTFIATATRTTDASKTITIDQDGNIVENWE